MANLRAAHAITQMAGLGWDENREKAIDRVAAAGKARQIDIWHAIYGRDPVALRKLQRILIAVFRARYPRDINAERIAEQALHEYMCPQCHTCTGSGNVKNPTNDNESIQCDSCHGSGVQRHSDVVRAQRMMISYGMVKHSAHKINWLVMWLRDNDRQINTIVNEQLERFAH